VVPLAPSRSGDPALRCMKAASCVLAEVVPQRLGEEPVVILTGPRTVGKSTLLATIAGLGVSVTGQLASPAPRPASRSWSLAPVAPAITRAANEWSA
jgi:energy-coupling factor transporter ATP-binding protein EcfA2